LCSNIDTSGCFGGTNVIPKQSHVNGGGKHIDTDDRTITPPPLRDIIVGQLQL
jgi:hypothetical protein